MDEVVQFEKEEPPARAELAHQSGTLKTDSIGIDNERAFVRDPCNLDAN